MRSDPTTMRALALLLAAIAILAGGAHALDCSDSKMEGYRTDVSAKCPASVGTSLFPAEGEMNMEAEMNMEEVCAAEGCADAVAKVSGCTMQLVMEFLAGMDEGGGSRKLMAAEHPVAVKAKLMRHPAVRLLPASARRRMQETPESLSPAAIGDMIAGVFTMQCDMAACQALLPENPPAECEALDLPSPDGLLPSTDSVMGGEEEEEEEEDEGCSTACTEYSTIPESCLVLVNPAISCMMGALQKVVDTLPPEIAAEEGLPPTMPTDFAGVCNMECKDEPGWVELSPAASPENTSSAPAVVASYGLALLLAAAAAFFM